MTQKRTKRKSPLERGLWLRLYTKVMNDPKVQMLSGDTFKAWVSYLCIAKENGGHLPENSVLSYHLRVSLVEAASITSELINSGLIDVSSRDGKLRMHDWEQWQYKSDNSTERSRKSRAKTQAEKVSEVGGQQQ